MSQEEEDEVIWPEVDELKTELLQALEKVDSNAVSYGCRGTIDQAPNPGIEVDGLGILGLPLSSRDAELLISKCRQSPFGKGEETVVDDSVRKSWELDASQFSLANPNWSISLANVIDRVHMGLGLTCHRAAVEAQLYKLLIYEKGAFFKPHQDSEKAPGMFGTLVICLPSKHEGGKVLLTHNKRKFEFPTAGSSLFGTTYGAWYSDVLHEVEEVTSGHRVVLTYNLIQRSSLPQKAPDADSKARLKRALELWEQASAGNEPDYPPYIIHQLQHFYSKNSANIRMLKGHDAARVRCLEAACKELEYGIYLAVYERTIEKDDECGDEEFGREEEFECITELDGSAVDTCPEYDSTCRLEDYDSDEEADESEHQGYTGNEGAPATFWYRQTVVLLVPPSRKLGFGWTSNTKYKHAERHLDLFQETAGDPEVTKQLYRLCHLLLPEASEVHKWNKPRVNYGWPSRRDYYGYDYQDHTYSGNAQAKRCFSRVAKLTLEHGWVELYDRVPLEQKVTTDALEALSGFLCTVGASLIRTTMDRMMNDTANLADKYRLLQNITQAFNEHFVKLSATKRCKEEFDAWYSIAFADILGTKQRASKDDGIVLGEIARTCQPEVGEQILDKLKSASTQTIAAFVISTTKEDPSLPLPVNSTFVERVLEQLWDEFQYAEPVRTHGAPVEALNQQELADIIDLAKKHGHISVSEAFRALSAALGKADASYVGDVLFPFVKAIMSHEIPSVIIEDDPDLFDAVSSYIQLVICTYVHRLVGDEPERPKDWSLPNKGCGRCEHCKKVGAFMADAKEKTLRYKVGERIRKHLTSEFHDYGETNDFNISTDTSNKPYHWVCTKVHRKFNSSFAKWKANRKKAQEKLKAIGGKGMVSLRTWLGDNFDAITACQTEGLPDLGSKAVSEQTPLHNVDASSLNASNNKKRKLGSSDYDGVENGTSLKRARPGGAVPDVAEVIDLT